MNKHDKIFVAGHQGMVGSAIIRNLKHKGYTNIITRTRSDIDLTDQKKVTSFLEKEQPDFIFMAAAKVGGIHSNNLLRADFLYQNIMIEANIIHAAQQAGVRRMLFLGSSCIYPRHCSQPIKEEYLLTGALEQTNEPYAIAKIAGIKLCENYNRQYGTEYISVMPTNLYGPNDNYDLEHSHVLPALIRKTHEAFRNRNGNLVVWGSGKPMREFLHVDDLADACTFLMEKNITSGLFNIGTGKDISIHDLSEIIREIVGFSGNVTYDTTKPDGTPRKLLDVSRMRDLGWTARIPLKDGIMDAYEDFKNRYPDE